MATNDVGQSGDSASAFDINAASVLWDALLEAWHVSEPPTLERAEEILGRLEKYLHEPLGA